MFLYDVSSIIFIFKASSSYFPNAEVWFLNRSTDEVLSVDAFRLIDSHNDIYQFYSASGMALKRFTEIEHKLCVSPHLLGDQGEDVL